jgi:hypothetical protein
MCMTNVHETTHGNASVICAGCRIAHACEWTMAVQPLPAIAAPDSLRRKDSLRGTEPTKVSVRLGHHSASHFEGSALDQVPEITVAVERIAVEEQAKIAA